MAFHHTPKKTAGLHPKNAIRQLAGILQAPIALRHRLSTVLL